MTPEQVLAEFEKAGALLKGHFILSSGRHSDTFLQKALAAKVTAKVKKRIDAIVSPAAALDPRFGFGVVGFTPRRQGVKTGNIFGTKRHCRSLKGAYGARVARSLGALASWREKHGASAAPSSISGILVILVRLVVQSSSYPIIALRRSAVS